MKSNQLLSNEGVLLLVSLVDSLSAKTRDTGRRLLSTLVNDDPVLTTILSEGVDSGEEAFIQWAERGGAKGTVVSPNFDSLERQFADVDQKYPDALILAERLLAANE